MLYARLEAGIEHEERALWTRYLGITTIMLLLNDGRDSKAESMGNDTCHEPDAKTPRETDTVRKLKRTEEFQNQWIYML